MGTRAEEKWIEVRWIKSCKVAREKIQRIHLYRKCAIVRVLECTAHDMVIPRPSTIVGISVRVLEGFCKFFVTHPPTLFDEILSLID